MIDKRAILPLNLIGIGFLLSQNKHTLASTTDGNMTWLAYMAGALIAGAVVAGIWHFARKSSKEQTAKHFVVTAWVIAGLLTIGSFQ